MGAKVVELKGTTSPQLKLNVWRPQRPTVRWPFHFSQVQAKWQVRLARFDGWCVRWHDQIILGLICLLLLAGVPAARLGGLMNYFEGLSKR